MSNRPLQLMLVDEDPTFRLGLRVWLEQLPGFQVVAEASRGEDTLADLRMRSQALETAFDHPSHRDPQLRPIDLVILDLGLGQEDPDQMPGLSLCQAIKTEFPNLPVLVLSAQAEPVLEAAARQVGANGYGIRGMPVRQLAQLIRQVATNQTHTNTPASRPPEEPELEPLPPAIPGPFTAMRLSMRLSGLQQIDAVLTELYTLRPQTRQSWLERTILEGRVRELKAARWLVNHLWATPQFTDPQWLTPPAPPMAKSVPRSWLTPPPVEPLSSPSVIRDRALIVPGKTNLRAHTGDLQTLVFEAVFTKIQSDLENISGIPLEIDILRVDKRRELFFTILRQLEDLLTELRHSNLQPGQLPQKAPLVVHDLWDAVIEAFFGKYYTVTTNGVEQAVVSVLQQEKLTVQREILDTIPLVPELLGHWLFQEALLIDGSPYLATTPEAMGHSEKLLEHLVIQVANATIQPLLNRLADVEAIKKSLYRLQLMSTREIERFRNDLAWRYRWDRLVNEPKAIFESQYRLLTLTPRGIALTTVYAPRRSELDQLSGVQWAVTMALETRDALAPRVRTVISLVGSGFVYVLTELVGRGIGLIGRGIFKGVGNAWQETRRPRRKEPPKFNEWE
jgi:DNA-binding NarL/FixJ family response regulator